MVSRAPAARLVILALLGAPQVGADEVDFRTDMEGEVTFKNTGAQRRNTYRYRCPSLVFAFASLLEGPRRRGWIRLEIAVRTHLGRGYGGSGLGIFLFPQESPTSPLRC